MNNGDHGNRGDSEEKRDWIASAGLIGVLTQAAFTFVGGTVGGYYLGSFLDRKLGTPPLFLLVLMFAGFGAGIYTVIWALQKYERRQAGK